MKTLSARDSDSQAGIPVSYAEAVIGGIEKGLLLVSADPDRKVIAANHAFMRRFDLDPERTVGNRVFDVLSSDDLDAAIAEVSETGQAKHDALFDLQSPMQSSKTSFRASITNVTLPDREAILLLVENFVDDNRSESQVRYLTNCDPLTGLVNRAWFMDRLKQDLERASLSDSRLALLVVDLNRFVEIRNSAGKATGDLILSEVAQRLRKILRSGDVVARLGVGTFVIMANVSDAVAAGIAERICTTLATPIRVGAYSVALTANVGISTFPEDGTSPNSLLENAALAAFRMKVDGGGFRFYRQERLNRERLVPSEEHGQQYQHLAFGV